MLSKFLLSTSQGLVMKTEEMFQKDVIFIRLSTYTLLLEEIVFQQYLQADWFGASVHSY